MYFSREKPARELCRHMKDAHPLAKPYQCTDCGLWFNTVHTVHDRRVHANSVHAQEVLSCSLCNFATYNQYRMTNHECTHSDQKLQCEYCNVSLSSTSALKDHRARHFDNQTYPCEASGKTFASVLSRKIHITGKHGSGFVCRKCQQSFDSTFQLAKHKKPCGRGAK